MARRTTRVGPSSGKGISNLVAFSNLSADFNLSDPLTNFTPSSFEPCPNSNISSALAEPGTIRGSAWAACLHPAVRQSLAGSTLLPLRALPSERMPGLRAVFCRPRPSRRLCCCASLYRGRARVLSHRRLAIFPRRRREDRPHLIDVGDLRGQVLS